MIKEHLVLSFSWLIYYQRFHRCGVNKPFRTFAFIALAAHIIVVALVASIILAFVGKIVADHMVLLIWSFKVLFSLSFISFFYLHLMMRGIMMNGIDRDIWNIFQRFIILFWFMWELKIFDDCIQVFKSGWEIIDHGLNVNFEFTIHLGWYLSLVNRSGTHILTFLCLNCMRSKRHNSLGTCRDPFIPFAIPSVVMN